MCNFYGHKVSKSQIIKLKQIEKQLGLLKALDELKTFNNGFEYSNAIILKKINNNEFEIATAKWEFTPPWIKNEEELIEARKQGIPWLNAKSETLLQSKMFNKATLHNRCLVLASYFFEWRGYTPEGAKKEQKYPYAIGVKNQPYFYFAGILQPWVNKSTGEVVDTFAIITTKANELMEQIHNSKKRMPTILPEDLAYTWLMNDLNEQEITSLACYQYPSKEMYGYTVEKNFKQSIEPSAPFDFIDLPALCQIL